MLIAGRKKILLVYGIHTSIRGLSNLPMQRTSQPSCEAHYQRNGMYQTVWRRPEKSLPLSFQLSPQYYTQSHLLIASFCYFLCTQSHLLSCHVITQKAAYCHLTFSKFLHTNHLPSLHFLLHANTHKGSYWLWFLYVNTQKANYCCCFNFSVLSHTKPPTITSFSLCF